MPTTTTVRSAVIALIAASASLAATGSAQAAFPGANGRIVLHSDRSIYTMDPSGDHRVQLPEDAIGFGGLSVSADGLRIAYSAGHQIHVVGSDGRGDKTITSSATANADNPAFSPDGKRIAYERGYGIWIMNADGSGQRNLTPGADITHASTEPAFSPDGKRIAYTDNQQIWTMNADGTGAVDLTPPVLICPLSTRTMDGSHPDWSPDGRRIVFVGPVSCDNSRGRDIWVMSADGSAKVNLIHDDATEDLSPVFSPDGTAIAFTRDVDGHPHVHIMSADGGAPARIPNGLYAEDGVTWAVAVKPPRIAATVTRKTVRLGRRVVISGKVTPAQGGRVTLHIKRAGSRAVSRRVRLSHSRFRYAYKPRRAGRYRIVAVLPAGAGHPAAKSRAHSLRVRP
jgi:TolB protein